MALPRKLKHMNLFNDTVTYVGQVEEVVLPVLTRKMEEWRGGGMDGAIKTDQGLEAMSLEWTCGGLMDEPFQQFGIDKHDGVQLRFTGSYQREDSGVVSAVEIVVRGRHSAIDMGTAKEGDASPFKVTTEASYYKITVDGDVKREIDIINMVDIGPDGVDRLAPHRSALGI